MPVGIPWPGCSACNEREYLRNLLLSSLSALYLECGQRHRDLAPGLAWPQSRLVDHHFLNPLEPPGRLRSSHLLSDHSLAS